MARANQAADSGGSIAGAGQGPSDTLLAALRRILRPLVRLFITRAIPFPLATELLRTVYVEVADEEFRAGEKRQTDSRIHLLTGVHRKDVKRLRTQRQKSFRIPRKASLTSQLIARWTTIDRYRDADGAPLPLARQTSHEGDVSFESLVRSLNTDIRPRVVLDEWLHQGVVRIDEEGRVCLDTDAFVPPEGSDELHYYFGRNTSDHLSAAVSNIVGGQDRFLERAASYNQLTAESVAELRELAGRSGMVALREVNERAMALQQTDRDSADAVHRMSFGMYFYNESEPREDEAAAGDATQEPRVRRPSSRPGDAPAEDEDA